jgi:NNP family nitrate/nitrite transporter-like MFS transporter
MAFHRSAGSGPPFSSQIPLLLLLAGIFFSSFLPRVILAPLLLAIEETLRIGHAEASRLFLLISAGVSLGLLLSGIASSRLSHRTVILWSCLMVGTASLVLSHTGSVLLLKSCLFFMGLGGGLYFPSGIAAITSLVAPERWGKALAIHELAPNVAFVAAPVVADLLGDGSSWRSLFTFMGLFCYGMAMMYWWKGRAGDFRGEFPGFDALREIAALPAFWMMVILFGLGVGGSIGVYTMTPLYLVTTKGFDPEAANALLAVARVPGVVMALASGVLADRLGVRSAVFLFSMSTGVFTALLAWSGESWIAVVVVLQSVLSVCFFPAGFAILSRIVEPARRSVVVSLCIPVAVLAGAGAVPSLLGLLAEQERFPQGFMLLGGLMMAASAASLFLRFEAPRRQTSGDS